MTATSTLSSELQQLHDTALASAEQLADNLKAISDIYWGDNEDAPLFRTTEETLEVIRVIEVLLAVMIGEIQCAA